MSVERILKNISNEKVDPKLMLPSQYQVIFYNDHYTTQEFVVSILMDIFKKKAQQAVEIMLNIHKDGRGVAGIYPLDVARTKLDLVCKRARNEKFPLKCDLEKVK